MSAGSEARERPLPEAEAGAAEAATGADPFAALAADYDAAFAHRALGRWLRARVHRRLEAILPPSGRVLDLGCGTGEDALWLAARGYAVDALDASAAMLERARRKAERAGVAERIRFHHQDLEGGLGAVAAGADAALADFGALNAVADRPALARALHARLQPGAPLVAVVMGPVCPWEIGTLVRRGRPAEALRRLRSGRPASLPGVTPGRGPRVWYPTPARLRRDLAPWFERVALRGIGTLLPATAMGGLVDRWPRLFSALNRADAAVGAWPAAAWLSDHYELVAMRREEP